MSSVLIYSNFFDIFVGYYLKDVSRLHLRIGYVSIVYADFGK